MNQSIYLMLGVPYAALFILGFMIYRGVRKNDEYRARFSSDGLHDMV